MYELKGVVESVGKVQSFASGFTKREIIVNTATPDSKYPNPVKVTFTKDRCSSLDGVKVGNAVTISFAINGRKWDGPKGTSYFVDIAGLKISVDGKESVPSPAAPTGIDNGPDDSEMPF